MIPPSLWKATHDELDYAIGLRDGSVFEFRKATLIDGRGKELAGPGDPKDPSFIADMHVKEAVWVHLGSVKVARDSAYRASFDRGVDIRLTDVVWCADAPHGS